MKIVMLKFTYFQGVEMKILKSVLLVLLMSVSFAGRSHASEKKDKSVWGESIKGIQIRLSADSLVLKFGQVPTFKCNVRNKGPHKWKLPLFQQGYRLEVDGRILTHPGKSKEWKLLKPGGKFSDVAIEGGPGWVQGGMFPDYCLALRPGKHTIRMGVVPLAVGSFDPPKPALCMSNTITVEVVALDGMAEDKGPLGMTIYGKRNELKLSSWDRGWGNCGIDFESGRVMAMPADIRKASESKRVKWMSEQGIDAVANISGQRHGLVGVDLAVIKIKRQLWREMTAGKAQEDMRDIKITAGKTDMLGPARGGYNHFYVVKTRDGNVFKLNIDPGDNRKRIVKFSYSRVQQTVDSISATRTTQIVILKTRPSIDECSGISIDTPNNWRLYINKDGSALLTFGGAGRYPQFPAGSFKFEEVYNTIALGEYGAKFDRPYGIAFHIPYVYHENPSARWLHYRSSYRISVYGDKHIGELFDKADEICEQYPKEKGLFHPHRFRERNPIKQPITKD